MERLLTWMRRSRSSQRARTAPAARPRMILASVGFPPTSRAPSPQPSSPPTSAHSAASLVSSSCGVSSNWHCQLTNVACRRSEG
jgi:hypothetical protein